MSLAPVHPTQERSIESNLLALSILSPLSRSWDTIYSSDLDLNSIYSTTIIRVLICIVSVLTIIPYLYSISKNYSLRGRAEVLNSRELCQRLDNFTKQAPRATLRSTPTKGIPNAGRISNPLTNGCYRNAILQTLANTPGLFEKIEAARPSFFDSRAKRALHGSLVTLIRLMRSPTSIQAEVTEAATTFSRNFQRSLQIAHAQDTNNAHDLQLGFGRQNNGTSFLQFLGDQFDIALFKQERFFETAGFLSGNCTNREALNADFLIADHSFDRNHHARDTIIINDVTYELCATTYLSMRHYTSYSRMSDNSWTKHSDARVTPNTTDNFRKGGALYVYKRVENSVTERTYSFFRRLFG